MWNDSRDFFDLCVIPHSSLRVMVCSLASASLFFYAKTVRSVSVIFEYCVCVMFKRPKSHTSIAILYPLLRLLDRCTVTPSTSSNLEDISNKYHYHYFSIYIFACINSLRTPYIKHVFVARLWSLRALHHVATTTWGCRWRQRIGPCCAVTHHNSPIVPDGLNRRNAHCNLPTIDSTCFTLFCSLNIYNTRFRGGFDCS
jgi:hypothetical protein